MVIYTQLSLTATPGHRYAFVAKARAVGPHTGLFTTLSVLALPGAIYSFVAKILEVPVPTSYAGAGPGRRKRVDPFYQAYAEHHERREVQRAEIKAKILLEEKELMEIIQIVCTSGVLDE